MFGLQEAYLSHLLEPHRHSFGVISSSFSWPINMVGGRVLPYLGLRWNQFLFLITHPPEAAGRQGVVLPPEATKHWSWEYNSPLISQEALTDFPQFIPPVGRHRCSGVAAAVPKRLLGARNNSWMCLVDRACDKLCNTDPTAIATQVLPLRPHPNTLSLHDQCRSNLCNRDSTAIATKVLPLRAHKTPVLKRVLLLATPTCLWGRCGNSTPASSVMDLVFRRSDGSHISVDTVHPHLQSYSAADNVRSSVTPKYTWRLQWVRFRPFQLMLSCLPHSRFRMWAHSRSVHVASPARFPICNSTTTFTQIEEDASKKARHQSESH